MKGKAIIPLVLGLGMGLLAIKFGMDTVRKAKGASTETARQVVRAKQDIDATVEITKEMLEAASTLDKPMATDPDFAKLEDVIGRVSAKSIPKGTSILKSMLAEPGTPQGVPGRIAPGYRAVGVEIDEVTGVAFNVRPGDWVDVIVVMDIEQSNSKHKETIAEVVLQRVEVAAIGLGAGGTNKGAASTKGKVARSATLLVPEADVPKLHLAATRGKVTLAMRGDEDETISDEKYTAKSKELLASMMKTDEATTETAAPTESGAGMFNLLGSMLKGGEGSSETSATTVTETLPPPPPPEFSMILSYGSTAPGTRSQAFRITYENANSNNVVSIQPGLATGQNSPFRPQPQGDAARRPAPVENRVDDEDVETGEDRDPVGE